ncbi:hypothetical protein BGZ61DRAFT_50466 [Ilyonectria robusta]|uniref:uncharacterized protein n=1 Tax=Ilyonectria robusta TaxID=1079257 RepID=UPI001E8DC700|nr:uncharacterized protein BGZ61DRAFT_50466 [Ilyonectria robusta]KAH8687083.1 hypothetical protein BGZ61DRAFT_50466 [Ilyonectria robusta]
MLQVSQEVGAWDDERLVRMESSIRSRSRRPPRFDFVLHPTIYSSTQTSNTQLTLFRRFFFHPKQSTWLLGELHLPPSLEPFQGAYPERNLAAIDSKASRLTLVSLATAPTAAVLLALAPLALPAPLAPTKFLQPLPIDTSRRLNSGLYGY